MVGAPSATWPRLSDVVTDSGGAVVGYAEAGDGAVTTAERLRPDVVIVAGDGAAPDLEVARALAERVSCAVLVLAHAAAEPMRPGAGTPRTGKGALVGLLVRPVRTGELAPALGASAAPLAELAGLRDEVQALQRRLDARKVIERAKGALMDRLGLAEPEAFRRIQKTAMDTRRTMADVAQAILLSEELVRRTGAGSHQSAQALGSKPAEMPAS